MFNRNELVQFELNKWHKGFYKDENYSNSLIEIEYNKFFEYPNDPDFPFDCARDLLCGSCNHFAVILNKLFNYDIFIMQGNNSSSFHAFCIAIKNNRKYYIDARGISTSFSEFVDGIRIFVGYDYTTRPATSDDIINWENEFDYNDEAYAFAEAIINEYRECYTL